MWHKAFGATAGHDSTGMYTGEWGMAGDQVAASSARNMWGRTGSLALGGSGYKREALANSFGIITSRQRATGNFLMNKAIPAFTAWNFYDSVKDGEDPTQAIVENSASYFGAAVGFRTGQAFGMATSKTLSRIPKVGGLFGATRTAGFIAGGLGAIIGGAAAIGAASLAIGSLKSDNIISKTAEQARYSSLNQQFVQTDLSLTHRQRALEQISKSALNNRGQTLGNEASILAGLM